MHCQEQSRESSATLTFAEFVSSLSFAELPAEVVEKCKLCMLDTMGCCIYGTSLVPVRKLVDMVLAEGGNGKATIIGTTDRTSASQAALVNGTSAHAFQLDEVHAGATLHPGSVVTPAVFAVAESVGGLPGPDIIASIVAGYEVGIRIGIAANGNMFKHGFHNQGTSGVFAAAAGASRALGLSIEQTLNALGIAGSQAAGLMAVQEGAMAKSFHSGRAAQSGVYAALLAARGYTGIRDVLEAPYGGFFSTLVGPYQSGQLIKGLKTEWETLNVGHKLWPAANGSITAMETLDRIMQENNLTADDLAHITAYVSTNTLHHCAWEFEPQNALGVLSAQMNLYYGLSVMALDREASPRQFSEARMQDPRIKEFIQRIDVRIEPGFDADDGRLRLASRLEVSCRDERVLKNETLYRQGSKERPVTVSEINEKFGRLTKDVIGAHSAQRIAALIGALDHAGFSSLMQS